MIPAFNNFGLLPEGIHTCNLQQLKAIFAFNVRREQLCESLTRCLRMMHGAGLSGSLIIDGSFATDKPNPSDMEVTLDVRAQNRECQDKALLFYFRNHLALKSDGVDWYPTLPDNKNQDFTLFFQYAGVKTAAAKHCKPTDLKGILRLTKW